MVFFCMVKPEATPQIQWSNGNVRLVITNNGWLVVEPYPSEKWWSSSVGMMKFPIYGKIRTCSKPPSRKWFDINWTTGPQKTETYYLLLSHCIWLVSNSPKIQGLQTQRWWNLRKSARLIELFLLRQLRLYLSYRLIFIQRLRPIKVRLYKSSPNFVMHNKSNNEPHWEWFIIE